MGMYVPKFKIIVFLAVFACLCGCGPMDAILPSTGTYKVNAILKNVTLDELSFIDSNDTIQPFFEEPVSNDPDVTALVVFLRNSRGNVAGWRVSYTLERVINERNSESDDVSSEKKLTEDESLSAPGDDSNAPAAESERAQGSYRDGDELVISVKSLDGELPVFPMPDNLPVGRYTLVSHVMSGKDILQRIEKNIYYMGRTVFSYDGIRVHLPGIAESSQVIPRGMVVMLETALNFDRNLNPYIIWYNGRSKIGEGYFSNGAGRLLWKAPEQSGFFSLRAEVFPVENFDGLSGYQEEISLLVSSKTIDVNLVSENIPQLLHWYTFEGNLNDSKMVSSSDRALKPAARNIPNWAGADGTYGLAAGAQDTFSLPRISVLNNGTETWQVLFRFKPLNDGVILCVQFGRSRDIFMNLKLEGHNLVLELVSSVETVSRIYVLPEQDSFIKAGFTLSILPKMLSANINVLGDYINRNEFDRERTGINAEIEGEFQILLGQGPESGGEPAARRRGEYTAIWDEFAIYFMPPEEIYGVYLTAAADAQPQDDESLAN